MQQRGSWAHRFAAAIAFSSILIATAGQPAVAKILCVNQHGESGCHTSIGAAVAAASPGDTVQVAHGTYKENVTVTTSISLVGDDAEDTIIDASGLVNGVQIMGTTEVVVSGFTVENADTAGIWIIGSSLVTLSNNKVINNDRGLIHTSPKSCPALAMTPFAKGEAVDCGEGVFLSNVDHSIVANNTVTGNAGGILVTDDTGPTHDNLITGNSILRNTDGDCGITLPSHSGAGVYHNTISGNDSSYNSGPGVGIFAPGPGSKAYGNVVINNHLRGNGNPGVTMHNHAAPGVGGVPPGAPPVLFDDNVILGNDISDNAADPAPPVTTGPTGIHISGFAPMQGTIISQNVITQQSFDIVLNVPAGSAIQVHLNNFPQNDVGLENQTTATVDATENWWGCSKGPGAPGCATVVGTALTTPWLSQPFRASGDN